MSVDPSSAEMRISVLEADVKALREQLRLASRASASGERRASDALELLRGIDYEEDSRVDRAIRALEGE